MSTKDNLPVVILRSKSQLPDWWSQNMIDKCVKALKADAIKKGLLQPKQEAEIEFTMVRSQPATDPIRN